jgi:nucleotide-binding universal stress UspA family protein
MLGREASQYYRQLQANAQQAARQEGLVLTTELVDGDEVRAIVECVQRTRSDLLILGIHRRTWLFGRLWNHTAHDLSQQLVISILAVH